MYVCMYVCIYVCIYSYVCMYVCMYICMYVCLFVGLCMYVCVCMYVRMYVCVCIYVCTYVSVKTHTRNVCTCCKNVHYIYCIVWKYVHLDLSMFPHLHYGTNSYVITNSMEQSPSDNYLKFFLVCYSSSDGERMRFVTSSCYVSA
jgi:hypothetical protein